MIIWCHFAVEASMEVVMETPSLQPPITFKEIFNSITITINDILGLLPQASPLNTKHSVHLSRGRHHAQDQIIEYFTTFLLFDPVTQSFPKKYTNMKQDIFLFEALNISHLYSASPLIPTTSLPGKRWWISRELWSPFLLLLYSSCT